VKIPGRATKHQIDVLWDINHDGEQRVIFECRLYKSKIKQKDLLAFRTGIEDVQSPDRPVYGFMVTLTGYQSGRTGRRRDLWHRHLGTQGTQRHGSCREA
jgi:hypothetical protein